MLDAATLWALIVECSSPKLDPKLVYSQIMAESSGDPDAVGPQCSAGRCRGLMQLSDSTGAQWHELLKIPEPYNPHDPRQNIEIGTAYFSYLKGVFQDTRIALAAYNWGMGHIFRLMRDKQVLTFESMLPHLPTDTQKYVAKIMTHYETKTPAMA